MLTNISTTVYLIIEKTAIKDDLSFSGRNPPSARLNFEPKAGAIQNQKTISLPSIHIKRETIYPFEIGNSLILYRNQLLER